VNLDSQSTDWASLSDRQLQERCLGCCADKIQWLLDECRVGDSDLALRGWAIAAQPDGSRFLLNGVPFEYSRYPISSPDLASIFWNIPTAESARFVCQTTITMESAFPDGFARLEFVSPGSDPEQSRSRAWYLPDPQNDLPMPSNAQIKRVIGTPDPFNYLVGGATTYKRLEAYLQSSLSKTF
jgi:hypothetical protein